MAALDVPRRRAADHPPSTSSSSLLSLHDDLLLAILALLDPYPDGFSVGRTCSRLHRLGTCDSLKLRVASSSSSATLLARTPRPAGRATFPTLAAAVAASRPGDTVLLDGGACFDCPAIAITWPLCLAAAAAAAPIPTLAATAGTPAALVFHASARVVGLAVTSSPTTGGACLEHRGGVLEVANCSLEVLEPGAEAPSCLPFLHSPILSTARTPGSAVHVHETRLAGAGAGALAVRAPTGVLSGVRCIPMPPGRGGDLFWLSVRVKAPARPPRLSAAGVGVTSPAAAAVDTTDLAARAKTWRVGRRRAVEVEEEGG